MNYAIGDWEGPIHASGFSTYDLWLAYFALGGSSTQAQIEHYVTGTSEPSATEHNLVAHALNERLRDLGFDTPVPYQSIRR